MEVTTAEGKDLSQILIDTGFAVRLELRSVSPEAQDLSALSSSSDYSVHHQSPPNQPSSDASLKLGCGDCSSESFSSVVQTTALEPSIESRKVLSQSSVDTSDMAIPPAFPHPCGYGSLMGNTEIARPGAVSFRIPKRKVCLIN